ncbi:MAG: hypothetical protein IJS48_01020 [Prevotella sp.]|nr:hypothetical protein [Prevotella sp.]
MKKLFILLLALGACVAEASAQYGSVISKKITSNTMNVIKVPRDRTFYFAAGGQLNGVTESHFKPVFGYEAALGYQWAMKRGTQLGAQLGIEAGITSRGWEYDQFYASHKSTGMAVFLSPINYVYRMGLGANNSIWLEPHIGAFAAIDVIDNYVHNEGQYELGERGYINCHTDTPKGDAGINVGLRLWIAKRINVDLSYRQGFIEFAEEEAIIQYRNHTTVSGYNGFEMTADKVKHSGLSGNLCLRIGVKLNK